MPGERREAFNPPRAARGSFESRDPIALAAQALRVDRELFKVPLEGTVEVITALDVRVAVSAVLHDDHPIIALGRCP